MFNLELYAIYLLNLLDDPLNAARWLVHVECAAVSASSAPDSTESMLCIGEIRKMPSVEPVFKEIQIKKLAEAHAAGALTFVSFIFTAGPDSRGVITGRSIDLPQVSAAVDTAKGNASAFIPGTTETYVMHDLRMEFNHMVRKDTKNRFKLREYIPKAEGATASFRPDGHCGFSGVVPIQYYGTLFIHPPDRAAGL